MDRKESDRLMHPVLYTTVRELSSVVMTDKLFTEMLHSHVDGAKTRGQPGRHWTDDIRDFGQNSINRREILGRHDFRVIKISMLMQKNLEVT